MDKVLNKINQTKNIFMQLVAPLQSFFGLSFGYMKVFQNGYYYKMHDNIECLEDFIKNANQASIFYDQEQTGYFDDLHYFTLWPKYPACKAMEIYNKYSIKDGITISKIRDDYTELYWFTGQSIQINFHEFILKNKYVLSEFIRYFDNNKKYLFIPQEEQKDELFKFSNGFCTDLPSLKRFEECQFTIQFLNKIHANNILDTNMLSQLEMKLSQREAEILSIMCRGFTSKIIAQKLEISIKTVQHHIEHIKNKTGLHFKTDLVKFYEDKVNNIS